MIINLQITQSHQEALKTNIFQISLITIKKGFRSFCAILIHSLSLSRTNLTILISAVCVYVHTYVMYIHIFLVTFALE